MPFVEVEGSSWVGIKFGVLFGLGKGCSLFPRFGKGGLGVSILECFL